MLLNSSRLCMGFWKYNDERQALPNRHLKLDAMPTNLIGHSLLLIVNPMDSSWEIDIRRRKKKGRKG